MSDDALDKLLAKLAPAVQELTLTARARIRELAPAAVERAYPGWKAIGFGSDATMGGMILAISPLKDRVKVMFSRGGELPDPAGLLEKPGYRFHQLTIREATALASLAFEALVVAAFALGGPGKRPVADKTGEKAASPGGYQVGASKTVAVPVDVLFEAWTDAKLRKTWLGEQAFMVRKATAPKSLRITWGDGSNLEVLFLVKGDEKSVVQIDQRKLPDAAAVTRQKEFWKEKLARLAEVL